MQRRNTLITIIGVVVIATFIGWNFLENARYSQDKRIVLSTGEWVNSPLTLNKIIASSDNAIKAADTLNNKWVLLFLGATDCGNNCRINLNTISEVQQKLVNIIPEVEQPVLAMTTSNMDSPSNQNIVTILLTPELAQSIFNEFKLSNAEMQKGQAKLLLIDPRGHIHAFFNLPNSSENIAIDITEVENAQTLTKKLAS